VVIPHGISAENRLILFGLFNTFKQMGMHAPHHVTGHALGHGTFLPEPT
jgi:hypothetical protein